MNSDVKIKLDENLGHQSAAILREAGFDIATVVQQKLISAPDRELINVCSIEGRCIVTLDLDFSNTLLFDPAEYAGIAVIRPSSKPSNDKILHSIRVLAKQLSKYDIRGKLWIVEKNRIRIYTPEENG